MIQRVINVLWWLLLLPIRLILLPFRVVSLIVSIIIYGLILLVLGGVVSMFVI